MTPQRSHETTVRADQLLLPEGTRLLHIGPAKTGTTSLQSGFHSNRTALEPFGVQYAGRGSQPRAAAGAIATGSRIAGHKRGVEAWPELVAEVQGSTAKRIVISSETFARAGDDGAKAVIDAFGADRTHVVITMRPLVDMLPSSWQQYVQTGARRTYEDWLDEMLNSPDTVNGAQPEFWRKTRIDALARRWGALVGPEQVTVVSLANRPRDFVLRTFEQFTGLPNGTLVPDPASENASLGFGVVEVVRRFNELFAERPGATADLQARLVEFGAIRHLRRTPEVLAADFRIGVPVWAADRAARIMLDMNRGLRDAGVRVVGDLDALTVPSRPPVESVAAPTTVSTEAAAELLVGMMLASARGIPEFAPPARQVPVRRIDDFSTGELIRHVGRRLLRGRPIRLRRPAV